MFCENCGNKISEADSFCSQCGNTTEEGQNIVPSKQFSPHNDKWWYRLLKVGYIALLMPLLLIVPLVWSANKPYYSSYFHETTGSYGWAIWYSFLSIIIYIVIARLIKISVLYIVIGQKPKWTKEFKKLF